jgi:hypothetical protein
MTPAIRIHAHASGPRGLVTGRDVVLDRWAPTDLPDQVLLDDWLSKGERKQIDREAQAMLQQFADHHREALRVDGLDLVDAWWWELLSEVFIWELRIVRGVERAVTALTPDRIEWHGIDRGQRDALEAMLGRKGTTVGSEPEGPAYPSTFGTGWRTTGRLQLVRDAALAVGIPMLARGNVLVHGHLGIPLPVAPDAGALTITLNPRSLPAEGIRGLARLARRGGWIGAATPIGRASARRGLRRSLSLLEASVRTGTDDPFESYLTLRAVEMLRQRGAPTIADFRVARRALAKGRLRAVVLPFDTPANARGVIQAARQTGVSTLVLQHGFAASAGLLQDGSEGDVAAVWSQADADLLRPNARGRVVVTGNPGVEHRPVGATSGPRRQGKTVVLVEYPFRMSALIDSRVKEHHVLTALRALAETRPGTAVVIRPHPGDHEPQALMRIAATFATIQVTVDSSSRFVDLLDDCDLLIAALSTGALEAGAAGIPVIFLNSQGRQVPPPFDGSGDLPTAVDVDQLIDLIPTVLAAPEPPGRQEMCEALGVRSGATEALINETKRLVAKPMTRAAG